MTGRLPKSEYTVDTGIEIDIWNHLAAFDREGWQYEFKRLRQMHKAKKLKYFRPRINPINGG